MSSILMTGSSTANAGMDSRDTRLYGAEALIRHQHPTEGLTLPMKFVPSLEIAGLIHYIDFFVCIRCARHCMNGKNKDFR